MLRLKKALLVFQQSGSKQCLRPEKDARWTEFERSVANVDAQYYKSW